MNGTQTLSRALDILFALSEANDTLSVSEIAEKVSIPESTTYRFIQTLEQNGIVERKGKSQIGLGMRILDLARSLSHQAHRELLPLALPIMERLTQQTKETSVLFVRSGMNCVCIQNVRSQGLLQFAVENGRVLPLYSGGSGKCILAYENERFIQRVVESLQSPEEQRKLQNECADIREKGYCFTHGEVDPDIFAVAAPVLDAHGLIVASLSIAGPNFKCNKEYDQEVSGYVVAAANQLSQKLGSVF
ncbi:IclR family transcriptional regulator [Paenibacillus segetis]|uniref:IclR family transcriptional regulator n=1 Tax=Paenibacillus segetis TaxID=1325360 RepID=A0ABQ1YCJ9_9BACL|nr:IclR family transcriptional regulator [Paenibacillus segetis]GGH19700.1 IclR family transcriptional regulator [Paenibacillus segetis]